jgi:arylsulfatase A-like enzyme
MRIVSIGLACCVALGFGCGEEASPPPPPFEAPPERIILILVDTLRRDHLGAYGADISTPNIDGLAARGHAYANSLSAFTSTTMSMGGLFTGRTPSIETGTRKKTLVWNSANWCGLARFSEDRAAASQSADACVPGSISTLAERLTMSGYESLGVTSNILLYEPTGFARGFRSWVEVGARTDEDLASYDAKPRHLRGAYGGVLADSVNAGVRDLLYDRNGDRFFLYVHYMDAHDYRELGISYSEAVERADAGIGDLLALLEAEGLLEGSQIILTSDHGERLGEKHPVAGMDQHYANPAFDYLVQVPFIASPPLQLDAERLIRGQDVMELILDLAGTPISPRSGLEDGELFVSEWYWQTYRRGGWKASFNRSNRRALLFDLQNDPMETTDVSSRHPERMKALRERVDEITAETVARPRPRSNLGLSEEDKARLRAVGYLDDTP